MVTIGGVPVGNVEKKGFNLAGERSQLSVIAVYPSYPFLILSCVHLVLIQGAVASSVLLRCRQVGRLPPQSPSGVGHVTDFKKMICIEFKIRGITR